MRYPLADTPTPHILRKYTYRDRGVEHNFEESAAPELAARVAKRPAPPNEIDQLEPKRSAPEPLSPSSPTPEPPTVDRIASLLDAFEQLPPDTHRYVLYNMCRSCDRRTLSTLVSLVTSALRHDVLGSLPPELAELVLQHLDFQSLCAVSQVCKRWYRLVESSEQVWKDALVKDELNYTASDLRRAKDEGWGYSGWTREPGSHDASSAQGTRDSRIQELDDAEEQMEDEYRDVKVKFEALVAPLMGNASEASSEHAESDVPASPSAQSAPPLNALAQPVNVYKAIYRRKLLIMRNWMAEKSPPGRTPGRFSINFDATDVITCLEFDEDIVIAGSDKNYINIYDTRSGRCLHHFDDHEGGVWALKYIAPDTIVSGSTDRAVRVWSISQGRCTHVFRGHSSTVRCLDIVQPVRYVDQYDRAYMVPEYPIIVTGSRDTTLRMWRLPGPEDPDYVCANPEDTGPYFIKTLHGHSGSVRAIDGYENTVVSGSYDNTVRVWRISTGKCRWELTGHQQKVYAAVIDRKRNRCISASMDWHVKVWCIETGTLLHNLEGHTSLVGLLDLNRTTLVSAAADRSLRVWDPQSGTLLHTLQNHETPITCFQHDEVRVVSGSDRALKVWDIRTGKLVGDLFEDLDLENIWQVRFDSRRCVAAVKRGQLSYLEILDFDYDPDSLRPGEAVGDWGERQAQVGQAQGGQAAEGALGDQAQERLSERPQSTRPSPFGNARPTGGQGAQERQRPRFSPFDNSRPVATNRLAQFDAHPDIAMVHELENMHQEAERQ